MLAIFSMWDFVLCVATITSFISFHIVLLAAAPDNLYLPRVEQLDLLKVLKYLDLGYFLFPSICSTQPLIHTAIFFKFRTLGGAIW